MSTPSSFIRRVPFLSLLIIIFIVFAFSSFVFARDPYPRKVRIKNDNANLSWATEPPIPYGSLYGRTLKSILSPSDQAKYCPTEEQALAQSTPEKTVTPWKCDGFFQPFGPINEWVKIERNPNPRYGDQLYAPPYSTSGGWWNWLVEHMQGRKTGRGISRNHAL